jgi:hypothetical protein
MGQYTFNLCPNDGYRPQQEFVYCIKDLALHNQGFVRVVELHPPLEQKPDAKCNVSHRATSNQEFFRTIHFGETCRPRLASSIANVFLARFLRLATV